MTEPTDKKRFILAAGGTGGHVFPALALAKEMEGAGHEVLFCTDARGQKFFTDVPVDQVEVIPSGGLVTGSLTGRLKALVNLGKGYVKSRRLISSFKPSAVIGFGGYPSAPPLLAAQHKKVPTVLHEQNSVMGKANRLIASNVNAVALSFPSTIGAPDAGIHTGNPIRSDIEQVGTQDFSVPLNLSANSPINILVMGGSLGAKFLSDTIPKALSLLAPELAQRISVTQQARDEDMWHVKDIYAKANINADVVPFVKDVASALSKCHLVICRSGATSVAEVAAAGRPAIFIPLDIHPDRHQVINAESLSNAGAAWVQPQSQTSAEKLVNLIRPLIESPKTLQTTGHKARQLAKMGSAKNLFELVLSISS